MFNLLAGNSDGHAKNLALLYHEGQQASLAPIYDLVCTRAIARIDTKLGLSIAGEFNPDKVTFNHWGKLAKACNIREQYLKKLLQQIAETLLDSVTQTRERFEEEHGEYPPLQRVQQVVTKLCKKTLKQ